MLKRKKTKNTGRRQRLRSNDRSARQIFSYYENRSDDNLNLGRQNQREVQAKASKQQRRRPSWQQRASQLLILVVVVIVTVQVLSLSQTAKVVPLSNNKANQNLLRPNAVYQTAANKALAASPLNRNKITIDSHRVSQDLLRQFPELASAIITLPLMAHRPIVYVQAAQPALTLAASNGDYILDNTGKTLLRSDNLPATANLAIPTVIDQSNSIPKPNQQALPTSAVTAITTITAQLAHRNISYDQLVLPPSASELDVHLHGQPYIVKFNLQSDDARQQAGTFLALQNQLKNQQVTPTAYIDVRLPGRAYYK